jgi:hypothetical protein
VRQRVFHCTVPIAGAIAAAVFVALVTITAIRVPAINHAETHLSRLTIVYKNQLHPSIIELEAREPQAAHKGETSSHESGSFKRQDQWI